MKARDVKRAVTGINTVDGAGVKLIRVLGHNDTRDIDPFLMLDAFDSTNPDDYMKGFPMHPHRGIETFTYLIEGEFSHRDTLGNAGRIKGGQAQMMTSGRGILHEEMPVAAPHLAGLQLWINMPAAHKMTVPAYKDILAADMPVVEKQGAAVRVVAGEYDGASGAKGEFVQPLILDITVNSGEDFAVDIPQDHTLFIYMFAGSGLFGQKASLVDARTAAIFDAGDFLTVEAGAQGCHFMLFAAKPLNEPIAWAGPIVMNTQQELNQAFNELRAGTFIKVDGPQNTN